ncbi:hypothetical protein [Autumnicola psychrophila]|uniref:Uncharacterized protein n=1 Tax=Autumnicola psychrophila TaxID=3075592 RepID=A0ABU3DPV3_9FLAO|nr:hypothetical protein [Zunongwangia sp. F225]MDT0685750.1 hypothetical protein [Zunongwangia sp. F225]
MKFKSAFSTATILLFGFVSSAQGFILKLNADDGIIDTRKWIKGLKEFPF